MSNRIEKAKEHIKQLYEASNNDMLLLHNWSFKQRLLSNAKELFEASEIKKEEQEMVILVILFMDIHLLKNDLDIYATLDQFRLFIDSDEYSKEQLDTMEQLLLFTSNGNLPNTELEQLVSDVRYSFLADKDYRTMAELWREELQFLNDEDIEIKEWRQHQLQLFRTQHRYYTAYAVGNWDPKKKKNLKKLVKAKKKGKRLVRKEKIKAKFKDKIVDRGVQTLYRVTLRNHIKLSDIADTKANILLSVNAIIISLALANLIPKLDNPSNQYLIYPTFIFIVFCVVSMVMSIMATRPNVTSGEFTKEDVKNKKVNLLFFGNFHKMELSNYEWAMDQLIMDRDYIYKSLTKDLYYLGIVLERKYRLLRWTYTVFMIGMIVSVITFSISLKFFGPDRVLPVEGLIGQ
ncbi:phosphohydrolase [Flagellimonas sp. 389]|uniref:Pycsar system effector family protein n=1 Tax=Flagellimonas sp. 389 TaxID=2835862 RepID=UPI001BD1CF0B|nr:Pycsar system effector family protein [Flagellimonas sp. 389]MBS9464311.1 phosphohydrolase [Flagellimonas sp. 389]